MKTYTLRFQVLKAVVVSEIDVQSDYIHTEHEECIKAIAPQLIQVDPDFELIVRKTVVENEKLEAAS